MVSVIEVCTSFRFIVSRPIFSFDKNIDMDFPMSQGNDLTINIVLLSPEIVDYFIKWVLNHVHDPINILSTLLNRQEEQIGFIMTFSW